MRAVFDFSHYREYLRDWIERQGVSGYGAKGRIANAIGVSSSLVSQILKGDKSLTRDQASDLADHLGLSEIEADYFQLLVDFDRAGSQRFQEKLKRKITALQEQSRQIGKRVPRHKELTNEQKAVYYSSWLYTGVRNLTAIDTFGQVNSIAHHLHLDPSVIHRVVRFLLENGLCKKEEESGNLTYGPASTHVDNDSPFVNKHHQNWRFQAIQNMERKREQDVFFTSPMSLSRAAADEIRKLLPSVIQTIMKIGGPSASEVSTCLNIDWFEY